MKSGNRILVITILVFSVEIMRDGSYVQPLTQIVLVSIVFSSLINSKKICGEEISYEIR